MEYSESKGILEKMITNETLAKMTRAPPHFNPKSNGFRSPTLPSHLNGKTMPTSLSSLAHSGSKSNPDQPRRSIIKLPGPPVNTPGAAATSTTSSGGLKSSRSCSLDKLSEKSLRGRSRKRSREDDPLDSSTHHHNHHLVVDERKDGCEQSTSASETVEPTKRKRRGQSSKRSEKRGDRPPVETSVSKLRVSSSTAVPGILDIYGLKSRPVDVSRYMVDVPLDKLLSESLEKGQVSAMEKKDSRGEDCRVVVEEINKVMRILPRHPIQAPKPFVENASQSEDVKVRLMLDLERPMQAEESQQQGGDSRQEIAASGSGSLDKARSKSLELFPTFRLEDLPLYTVGDFLDRLKLPVNDSLETLISYSKPSDPAVSASSDKNPRYEGIPPFPFSFSPCGVRIDPPRNGKTQQWSNKDNNPLHKTRSDPTPVKAEPAENNNSSARLKEEESKDQERGKEKSRAPESTRKGFSIHPELPSLQIKRDDGETPTPHSCRSLSFPGAMPCSPGAQAATILCNMANSDEKEFPPKGKQAKEEAPVQKTLKLARVVEERETRRESSGHQAGTGTTTAIVKKSPVSEKKRSLSQMNHSLASVSKRLSSGATPDPVNSARSSSSGHGFNKPEDHRHHQQQHNNNNNSNNHHHHHHRESPAAAGKQSSGSGNNNKVKEKESQHQQQREGKSSLNNGLLALGASKNNSSSAKAAVASRRESSSLSRSQHSLAKSKTKLR